jgi:hypothetical protein
MAKLTDVSPAYIAKRMQLIVDHLAGDQEVCHVEMDQLMCDLLETLGYDEAVRIFRSEEKWYA